MIQLKRAYERASSADGTRVLVDRLWPHGFSKARLQIDAWLKDVGPSTALRRWFNHDPAKWDEFRKRYARELDASPDAWRPLLSAARRATVTLIYSSHDVQHNNAVALLQYLHAKRRRAEASKRTGARPRPRGSSR